MNLDLLWRHQKDRAIVVTQLMSYLTIQYHAVEDWPFVTLLSLQLGHLRPWWHPY